MTKQVVSLREKQKAETRSQLIISGIELFLHQGFTNTTIEQIVEPLGMAKRTFFRYFATKEDLLFEWQDDKTDFLVATLIARPVNEAPLTSLCETLAVLLKSYDASKEQALSFIRLSRETPALIGRYYERRIVREQKLAEALITRDSALVMNLMMAKITVGTVMSAWAAALDEWYDNDGRDDLREIVRRAFALIDEL